MNSEFRFPLIDLLATPILAFGGIRGRIFLDVGGAWLNEQASSSGPTASSRTTNGAPGGSRPSARGFSVYFLGLPWNVDFAKQWDFNTRSRTGRRRSTSGRLSRGEPGRGFCERGHARAKRPRAAA